MIHWPSVVWTSSPSSTFRSLMEVVLLGVVHVPGEAARVVPARDDGVCVRGRAADLADGARQGAALSIRVENGDPVVAAVSLSRSPVVAGQRIAVGAMVKASAAAAVITHLDKRRDFIHMATASISYVFQMQLLEAASHESAPATGGRDVAGG